MCTLIAGLDVLEPGTLVLGANRDESPGRPSSDPTVLRSDPRVIGGRDLKAGGTWLATRESRFVTALMNRPRAPDDPRNPSTFRTRGLLCLEAAEREDGTGASFLAGALDLVQSHPHGHCTLVGIAVGGEAWAIHVGHRPPVVMALSPGWHVITHQDLDDPDEPRTRSLMEALRNRTPRNVGAAIELLQSLLHRHGDEMTPAVCLHRDVFPTVSSSILALGAVGPPLYLHASGPPCVTPYRDHSALLSP